MTRPFLILFQLIFFFCLISCHQNNITQDITSETLKSLHTEIWYRERIALPLGSTVKVTLENVAKMDIKAEIIAVKEVVLRGTPPYSVNIEYDSTRLNKHGLYVLRAQIEKDGNILFTNKQSIEAFPKNTHFPIKIMVQRRDHTASQVLSDNAHLTGTYWRLLVLAGTPVKLGAQDQEVYMILKERRQEVQGYAGCNTFLGDYNHSDNNISFTSLLSSRKYCEQNMAQEHNFFATLVKSKSYDIHGKQMTLFDKTGLATALFESRYTP